MGISLCSNYHNLSSHQHKNSWIYLQCWHHFSLNILCRYLRLTGRLFHACSVELPFNMQYVNTKVAIISKSLRFKNSIMNCHTYHSTSGTPSWHQLASYPGSSPDKQRSQYTRLALIKYLFLNIVIVHQIALVHYSVRWLGRSWWTMFFSWSVILLNLFLYSHDLKVTLLFSITFRDCCVFFLDTIITVQYSYKPSDVYMSHWKGLIRWLA